MFLRQSGKVKRTGKLETERCEQNTTSINLFTQLKNERRKKFLLTKLRELQPTLSAFSIPSTVLSFFIYTKSFNPITN